MEVSEAEFLGALRRWNGHYHQRAHMSNPRQLFNCDAYKDIVLMGEEALPYILNALNGKYEIRKEPADCVHLLPAAVGDIVGDELHIPEELRGRVEEIQNFTREWLVRRLSS